MYLHVQMYVHQYWFGYIDFSTRSYIHYSLHTCMYAVHSGSVQILQYCTEKSTSRIVYQVYTQVHSYTNQYQVLDPHTRFGSRTSINEYHHVLVFFFGNVYYIRISCYYAVLPGFKNGTSKMFFYKYACTSYDKNYETTGFPPKIKIFVKTPGGGAIFFFLEIFPSSYSEKSRYREPSR